MSERKGTKDCCWDFVELGGWSWSLRRCSLSMISWLVEFGDVRSLGFGTGRIINKTMRKKYVE